MAASPFSFSSGFFGRRFGFSRRRRGLRGGRGGLRCGEAPRPMPLRSPRVRRRGPRLERALAARGPGPGLLSSCILPPGRGLPPPSCLSLREGREREREASPPSSSPPHPVVMNAPPCVQIFHDAGAAHSRGGREWRGGQSGGARGRRTPGAGGRVRRSWRGRGVRGGGGGCPYRHTGSLHSTLRLNGIFLWGGVNEPRRGEKGGPAARLPPL